MNNVPLLSSFPLEFISLSFPETHNCWVYNFPSLSIVKTPFAASPMMVILAPTVAEFIFASACKSGLVQLLEIPPQVAMEK